MQTRHLPKTENCATIGSSNAPSPQPPAYDNIFILYLQERKRSLMLELSGIEKLQAQIKEGKPCFIGS
jgi:hypothetical protein